MKADALRRVRAAQLRTAFEGKDSEAVGRSTAGGLFVPSVLSDLEILFDRLPLTDCRRLADLGSGDGRVVLLAGLYTEAVGLELDPGLVAAARARAMSLGLGRAQFEAADFLAADLNRFDILFIYPDKPIDRLAAKLGREFTGRLVVYGPNFPAAGLTEEAAFDLPVNKARVFRRL